MEKDLISIMADQSGLSKEIIMAELGPMFRKLGMDGREPNLGEIRRAVALYLQKMVLDSPESNVLESPLQSKRNSHRN